MSNIQRFAAEGEKSHRIFAATICTLKVFTADYTARSTKWMTIIITNFTTRFHGKISTIRLT